MMVKAPSELTGSTLHPAGGLRSLIPIAGTVRLSQWQIYAFATTATVCTLVLRLALDHTLGGRPTLILFAVPILLSGFVGGLRAGLFATALTYFLASFFLVPPFYSFKVGSAADRWQLALVVLVGIVISGLCEALLRAQRRAEIAVRKQLQAHETAQSIAGRYRALFENAPDGIVIADRTSHYLDANPSICQMLGYTRQEMIGLHASDIVTTTEIPRLGEALSAISTQSDYHREWQFRRKNGTIFSAEVVARQMPDGNLMAVIRDITEVKRVDEALRKSETQLQTIVENIREAVVVSDPSGQLLHFNHAALDMMGYANLEEGRRNFEALADTFELSSIDGTPWPVDQWPLARILRGEKLDDLEARMRRINTPWEHIYSFSGTTARDTEGRPLMAIVTFSDITEHQRAETAALRLAAIVESSADAVIGKDLNSIVTSWNDAAEKMFGYSAPEMVGRSIRIIVPPGHQDEETQLIEKVRRGEHVEHFDTERLTKSGGLVSISLSVSPIKDSHGRVIGASKVARDISARKRAENELRESEERFRTMANSIPQLAWVAGPDGSINWYNERWYSYTGTTPEQMTGWGWQTVHDPAVLPEVLQKWNAAIASGKTFEMEFPLRSADGTFRRFLTRVQPLKNSEGKVSQWFGTNTDIDRLKQAELDGQALNTQLEQRVLERTAQLQSTNKELEAFCYSVSHDLRAPLRTLDGFSLALLEDYSEVLDAHGQDYLNRIRAGSQRMGHLIDDLLNLSRVSRGELTREQVDLTMMAGEVIEELRSETPERKVEFIAPDGLVGQTDPRLMRIVLTNLLGNAWKFTNKQPAARIEFGSTGSNGSTEYFVRDNGAGFDETYASKLFGAFQRLHSASEFPGTGIGLATVQRIIQRQGGRVWADGKVDHGATFHFMLLNAEQAIKP